MTEINIPLLQRMNPEEELLEKILVGDEDCCQYHVLTIIMIERCSTGGILYEKWRSFSEELQIKPMKVEEFKNNPNDLFPKILELWRLRIGYKATLKRFLEHLEKLEMKDVAETIRDNVYIDEESRAKLILQKSECVITSKTPLIAKKLEIRKISDISIPMSDSGTSATSPASYNNSSHNGTNLMECKVHSSKTSILVGGILFVVIVATISTTYVLVTKEKYKQKYGHQNKIISANEKIVEALKSQPATVTHSAHLQSAAIISHVGVQSGTTDVKKKADAETMTDFDMVSIPVVKADSVSQKKVSEPSAAKIASENKMKVVLNKLV